MAAKKWYQVRPGKSAMVDFLDGDTRLMPAGHTFKGFAHNPSILRLLRGKRPRLRALTAGEVAELEASDEPIVVLPDES